MITCANWAAYIPALKRRGFTLYMDKEILTLDNPQQINLSQPLPFLKGKKVEILIIVENVLFTHVSLD